jgi:hypothetical protein
VPCGRNPIYGALRTQAFRQTATKAIQSDLDARIREYPDLPINEIQLLSAPKLKGVMKFPWPILGFLCLGDVASAGSNVLVEPSPAPAAENLGAPWSFDFNSTYTFGSHVERSGNLGSQAEYRYEIQALKNFRITGDYYLQLGVDYERFDFSRSNAQFPYSFTSLSGEVILSYWSGDSYYPVIRLEPGIYYTRDHITGNSFDLPIRITPGFKLTPNLYVIFGCSIDAFTNPVVFPIGGFNWKISDHFNCRAIFPRPRLSYLPNENLEIYLGAELIGNGYRNGPTNDRRTNNAIIEYDEQRVGVGIDYTLRKGVDLEATAGWTIQRTYDYIRAGPVNRSRGSPYIRLDLKIDLF